MSLFSLCRELIERDQVKEALDIIEKNIKKFEKKELYNFLIFYTLNKIHEEKYVGAIYLLEYMKNKFKESSTELNKLLSGVYNDYGNYFDKLKDYENAIINYLKSIEYNPNLAAPYNGYADVLRIKGNYVDSEKYFKKAIALDPEYALAHNNYAALKEKTNRYVEAENLYKKALDIDNTLGMAAYNLANLLRQFSRYNEAEMYYKVAIEHYGYHDDYNIYYYVNYAQMLKNMKEYTRSKEVYEDILNLHPSSVQILNSYAILLEHMGDFNNAEKLYKKALEIEPHNALTYLNISVMLKITNKNDEAEKYLKQLKDNKYEIKYDETKESIFKEEISNIKYEKHESHYIYEHVETLKIEYVHVDDVAYQTIKIGCIQIDYNINTTFPYYINDDVNKIKEKILKLIDIGINENVKILLLPELSINFNDKNKRDEFLEIISNLSNDMIIIAGSYYNQMNENISPVIIDNKIFLNVKKINPSLHEIPPMGNMKSGDMPCIFSSKYGIFSVLVCKDIEKEPLNLSKIAKENKIELQMIFVPEHNRKWLDYEIEANKVSKDHTIYVMLSNRSRTDGEYGGTSIYGKIRREILSNLQEQGLRRPESSEYQILEISDEEGIIFAEMDIVNREPEIPQSTWGRGSNIGEVKRILLENT